MTDDALTDLDAHRTILTRDCARTHVARWATLALAVAVAALAGCLEGEAGAAGGGEGPGGGLGAKDDAVPADQQPAGGQEAAAAEGAGAGDPATSPTPAPRPKQGAAPATLALEPVGPVGQSVQLRGTAPDGPVSIVAARGGEVYARIDADASGGRWSATLTGVPYGRSALALDAGGQSLGANLTRLAPFALEFRFTAFPVHEDIVAEVLLDIDAAVSAPMYDGRDVAHPGHATVHDVMAQWEADSGTPLEYGYFSGSGFALSKVDGVGSPLTAAAPPYWCYKLNGASASLGLSLQAVEPGDEVLWEYAGCA